MARRLRNGCTNKGVRNYGRRQNVKNHYITDNIHSDKFRQTDITFKPMKGTSLNVQYFVITPQHYPQFTTDTIHYCNIGIRQSFLKNSLTVSALVTDLFNTRRWDIHSDNAVYPLINNSKNRSRMFWLGITYNFNAYKPLKAMKKQEEDRSVIRLDD